MGGAAGFATGLLMGVALTAVLVRRYRRKRRELELGGLT